MTELTTIMVVDDDASMREALGACLQDLGNITIIECESGKEALDKLAATKPQLILLDVLMKDMNGTVAYWQIRQLPDGKNLPIIFVTARAYTSQILEYKRMGAAAVISKPFDLLKISREVSTVWQAVHGGKAAKP